MAVLHQNTEQNDTKGAHVWGGRLLSAEPTHLAQQFDYVQLIRDANSKRNRKSPPLWRGEFVVKASFLNNFKGAQSGIETYLWIMHVVSLCNLVSIASDRPRSLLLRSLVKATRRVVSGTLRPIFRRASRPPS